MTKDENHMKCFILITLAMIGASASLRLSAQSVVDVSSSYTINRSPIGPLGFIDGLVQGNVSPYDIYARTDVNGMYKWNTASQAWTSVFDGIEQYDQDGGVLSIATDPFDSNIIYAAAGSVIYKSFNAGSTWYGISTTSFQIDANANYRNVGERLMVDPNNSNIVYFGTQNQGLYLSRNGGYDWQQVTGVSAGVAGLGVSFVVFDKPTGGNGTTQTIYVGVLGGGVYKSINAGSSWTAMAGQPVTSTYYPNRAQVAPDGTLYVTYTYDSSGTGDQWASPTTGAVVSYKGSTVHTFPTGGTQQLPSSVGFSSIALDASNSLHLIVGTFLFGNGCTLWNTLDGGTTWNQLTTAYGTKPEPWWADYWFTTGFAGLIIDRNPNSATRTWVSDGFSVWGTTTNTTQSNNTAWTSVGDGIEELVVNDVHKIPGGPLLIATDDVEGFTKTNLTTVPTSRWFGAAAFGNGTSVDFEEQSPLNVVRVGGSSYKGAGWGSYSSDGGNNWTDFGSIPSSKAAGSIAASASNASVLAYIPASGTNNSTTAYYSSNRGKTWTAASGVPNFNYINDFYSSYQPIASDRVSGSTFYVYASTDGSTYKSTNSGKTYTKTSHGVLPVDYQQTLKAVPGVQGELWINFVNSGGSGDGIWRSTNGGTIWTQVAGFTEVDSFGFGVGSNANAKPVVYIYGTLNGTRALYSSASVTGTPAGDLSNATWGRMTNDTSAIPNANVHAIEGDRETYGTVYVGTSGRGVLYLTHN